MDRGKAERRVAVVYTHLLFDGEQSPDLSESAHVIAVCVDFGENEASNLVDGHPDEQKQETTAETQNHQQELFTPY